MTCDFTSFPKEPRWQLRRFRLEQGGGRVVRWCCVNFQCRGVLLIWITVGQGPTAFAIGAGGGCLAIFYLVYHFSFLSPSFLETARYSLKYRLKGPLSPKQPTNQALSRISRPALNPLTYRVSFSVSKISFWQSFTDISWSSLYVMDCLACQYWPIASSVSVL